MNTDLLQQMATEICNERKKKLRIWERDKKCTLENKEYNFKPYAEKILKVFRISNAHYSQPIYQIRIQSYFSAINKACIKSSISFCKPPYSDIQAFYTVENSEILTEANVSEIIPLLNSLNEMNEWCSDIAVSELYNILKDIKGINANILDSTSKTLIISLNIDSE